VSHDPSRKRFIARVLGLAAVSAVAPGTVAGAIAREPKGVAEGKPAAFRLIPQPRAVARRQGST